MRDKLQKLGIRVELDIREEKLGYRMRESQTKKVPYTLVIGDKEVESNSVNYRLHGNKETKIINTDDFCSLIIEQIKNKSL